MTDFQIKGEGGEGMGAIIRERYLQKLIDRKENGMIKVITGIKKCGKSYFFLQYNRIKII